MDPDIPEELVFRLRPAEQVLWWGRPGRLAVAGRRDLAALPVIAIAAATAAVAAYVPGPAWHPVIATIFRFAFSASGVSLIATYVTIVVRQRRRRFYAITRDRVLLGNDVWSGGFRAVPLERIVDVTVDAGKPGEGTVTLAVDDGTFAQLAYVTGAERVRSTLLEAREGAQRRG